VTKLDRLQFDSKEAQQAATIRKMLVAMADDWRVLLIKLADRLHNMRTLAVMPEWKQRRGHRLGVEAQFSHDLGHRDGVRDVGLARAPELPVMGRLRCPASLHDDRGVVLRTVLSELSEQRRQHVPERAPSRLGGGRHPSQGHHPSTLPDGR
jgi:hypothetical protein